MNNSGSNTLPWGTPLRTLALSEWTPFRTTIVHSQREMNRYSLKFCRISLTLTKEGADLLYRRPWQSPGK